MTLAAPAPANAYLCDEAPPVSMPHPELPSRSLQATPSRTECKVPEDDGRARRTNKRGSMSGLTVFVLAVAAALLIPIGRRGIPSSADPYGDEWSAR